MLVNENKISKFAILYNIFKKGLFHMSESKDLPFSFFYNISRIQNIILVNIDRIIVNSY